MIQTDSAELEKYLEAERQLGAEDGRRGFLIDAVLYAVVNAVLITVNLLTVPEFLWCLFPLVGWGIGLTFHYLFGVRWVTREADSHEERVVRHLHENERRAA